MVKVPADSFAVRVRARVPQLEEEIQTSRAALAEAEAVSARAAAASRQVVHRMLACGLSGAEVAAVLGVSKQRVSQLANDTRDENPSTDAA